MEPNCFAASVWHENHERNRFEKTAKDRSHNKVKFFVTFQDLKELQERYKSQTKDLRDAIAQRKIAMEEFTDINER